MSDLNLMNSIPTSGSWFSGKTFAKFVARAVAKEKKVNYISYLYMGVYEISKENNFFTILEEAAKKKLHKNIPKDLAQTCTKVLVVKISELTYFLVPLCWPEVAFEISFMANIKTIGKIVEIENPHMKYPAFE